MHDEMFRGRKLTKPKFKTKLEDKERTVPVQLMSRVMRKPAFCICENKDAADQLRGNRKADQRLYFRYTYSVIPLLSKTEISSL